MNDQADPKVPHAGLIAQARRRANLTSSLVEATLLRDLTDTLEADREATNQIVREETALLRHKYRGAMSLKGRAQLERDALAHVIKQAPHGLPCATIGGNLGATCDCWKSFS